MSRLERGLDSRERGRRAALGARRPIDLHRIYVAAFCLTHLRHLFFKRWIAGLSATDACDPRAVTVKIIYFAREGSPVKIRYETGQNGSRYRSAESARTRGRVRRTGRIAFGVLPSKALADSHTRLDERE